jgi:hypothetical protein
MKRPSRFPVPQVFETFSVPEFCGDLVGEKSRLDTVKKPV